MSDPINSHITTHIPSLLTDLSRELAASCQSTSSKDFNIFRVLGISSREVFLCRFLAYLLDPSENHGAGAYPLLTFVREVLNIPEFAQEDAWVSEIRLEDPIDQKRRVDLVIYSPKGVFPLEVKVWAEDQDAQLSDYFHYYHKYYAAKTIYYLTPTSWSPSQKSQLELDNSQIVCIGFRKDIYPWLDALCQHTALNEPIRNTIHQLKEVIQTMCQESNELKAIKTVLGLNQEFTVNDHLTAAVCLLNHKDDLKKAIMHSYLKKWLFFDSNAFSLHPCKKEDQNEIGDTHAISKIVKEENHATVAWICVEVNLYIVAKKVKSPNDKCIWNVGSTPSENYHWQYISPYGKRKKFPLSSLSDFPDKIIDITPQLNDINMDS